MKTTHKRILGVAALALFSFGAVAAGCGSKRTATGTKPTALTGGETGKKTQADGTADPDAGTCTDAEEGLCICVPGGFESGGEIWDFACCFSKQIYVIYCGDDSSGCDPTTFTCAAASTDDTTSSSTGG
ncbi:MAG: hypothetical protein U0414_29955 [Polyangiaceae bacterium]